MKLDASEDRQLVEMEDRNDPALNPDLENPVGRRTGEKRSLYLSRRDFEVHGYTDGCRGCLELASGKPRAGSFLSPHSLACRRRMEDAIKVTDPARWGRWLLRRGQEEIDREGIAPPSGDAGAPSGPADPVAAVNANSESEVSAEASMRKPGHQEEGK